MLRLADIFSGRQRRNAIEGQKYSLANPPAWWWDGGQGPTAAGISVTELSAMRFSVVYACVGRRGETLGRLPCKVYREGTLKPAKSLREYSLLKRQPNSNMTAMTFWETLMANLDLWGNAYAEKQYDRAGRLVALWPRSSAKTNPTTVGGALRFETTDTPDGKMRTLEPQDVLHIPGLSLNGIKGLSKIAHAREAIALGLATEKYGSRFFANDSRPGGMLSPKQSLSVKDRQSIRDWWEEWQAGENKHRVAVLPVDLQWQPVGMPNDDAQFLETRGFQARDIARIFNVPAVLLHLDDKAATYASAEQFFLSVAKFMIGPEVERFEQAINVSLFPEEDYYCKFNLDALQRGDFKTRQEGRAQQVMNGGLTFNEWRESEELDPVEGGDRRMIPANFVLLDENGEPPKAPQGASQPAPASDSMARAWFHSVARRIAAWTSKDEHKVRRECQPLLDAIGQPLAIDEVVSALLASDIDAAYRKLFPGDPHV